MVRPPVLKRPAILALAIIPLALSLSSCSNNDVQQKGADIAQQIEGQNSKTRVAPTSTVEVIQVSEEDIEGASRSLTRHSPGNDPITVTEGRYVVSEEYKLYNTLTVLELNSGEKLYFVSTGKQPFGSKDVGIYMAADEFTRDITSSGKNVRVDESARADVASMLSDLKDILG